MRNRISEKVYLVFAAVLILAGCQLRHQEQVDALALARGAQVISAPSDDAVRALEATGGLDVWKKTATLQLGCVVTFYQPDGSFYLTEQNYEIYPWLDSIRISADEPQGAFVWNLSDGQFNVVRGITQINALPEAVSSRCFSEAVLDIVTAPVRFLDGSVKFSEPSAPVRIQGKWYYPIDRQVAPPAAGEKPEGRSLARTASEMVFYQEKETSIVDMIRFPCASTGATGRQAILYVRGYDYEKAEETGPRVPTSIEIYESDARDRSQRRLVKIDCRTVESMQ